MIAETEVELVNKVSKRESGTAQGRKTMAKMTTLAATEAATAAVVAAEAAAAAAAAAATTAAADIAGTTVLPTRDKLGRPPPTKAQMALNSEPSQNLHGNPDPSTACTSP